MASPRIESERARSHEPRSPRGFRRLVPYLLRHKARLCLGLATVPVFTGINLVLPQVWGEALGRLAALAGGRAAAEDSLAATPAFWWQMVGLLCGLWLVYSSVRFLGRWLLIGLSRFVEEALRNDLFAHLQRLPAAFFDQARVGDLVSRSTQDVELLRFMAGPALFFGASMLVVLPGAILLIFSISTALGLVVLALLALIGVSMRYAFPALAKSSRAVQDAQADLAAKAQEDFTGIRVVQSFAREADERAAFERLSLRSLDTQLAMARSRAVVNLAFVAGAQVAPFALIAAGVLEGLPVSKLFAAFLYMQQLVWPLMIISWVAQTWHRARAAADRLDEVFDAAPEELADAELGPRPAAPPAIAARGLTFRYGSACRPALQDVSFELRPGQVLGLVGPIGSGKTTLLSLLTRLYEPERGQLFVGGDDVRDLSRAELRRRFAVAPQEPFLFSDTLRRNILFASPVRDGELVATVVQQSRLEPDLEAFPERIDQMVGERGLMLSGGQKQRTSLARALASDRAVLALDDTLSAVDHATERHILDVLRQRGGKQTTIVIAHRLEAVREADLILVLEEGRVIERGRHDELLGKGGWYARTWEQQQREDAA